MSTPRFSVVIPAYNNAAYLGEAIQSVLNQTCGDLELVIVNDASPDDTTGVVNRFHDPRIKYIIHEQNQGLSAARNTGMRESRGEFIALLDGDDFFHPDKLEAHLNVLDKQPEVGVTYNGRFELNHSAETIRELWHPPLCVGLADLIFGFPFSPSDMILRREWAFRVNLFDPFYTYVGEDLDINCRLALAGCKFAGVNRALNYRRYYSGRSLPNLQWCVETTIRALDLALADPRCPADVRALKDKARANHYLLWSIIALTQDETLMGQEYCLKAVRYDPAIIAGKYSKLAETVISYAIVDESVDHDLLLRRIVKQMPSGLEWRQEQCDRAVAYGYLLRGLRAVMWGRIDDGREHFEHAYAMGGRIYEPFLDFLSTKLLEYEMEFGPEATRKILQDISSCVERLGGKGQVRRLNGHYSFNKAFLNYRAGRYSNVPRDVLSGLINDPHALSNRGVFSILFRSMVAMGTSTSG